MTYTLRCGTATRGSRYFASFLSGIARVTVRVERPIAYFERARLTIIMPLPSQHTLTGNAFKTVVDILKLSVLNKKISLADLSVTLFIDNNAPL